MARSQRITIENSFYHVYNRANARKSIYLTEHIYSYFIYLLDQLTEKFDFEILAFCVMKNHYHLLLKTNKSNLSEGMQFFGKYMAKKINEDLNTDGPVFKSRFNSIHINKERYLLHVSRYIHLNPVEAKIVSHPKDYQWSSFKDYSNEYSSYDFLNTSILKQYFIDSNEYCEFVALGLDRETKKFYGRSRLFRQFEISKK